MYTTERLKEVFTGCETAQNIIAEQIGPERVRAYIRETVPEDDRAAVYHWGEETVLMHGRDD